MHVSRHAWSEIRTAAAFIVRAPGIHLSSSRLLQSMMQKGPLLLERPLII